MSDFLEAGFSFDVCMLGSITTFFLDALGCRPSFVLIADSL